MWYGANVMWRIWMSRKFDANRVILSITLSAITFLSWPCMSRLVSTGNANANALAACLPAGAMLGSCTDGICIPIDGLSGTMPRLHSSHWRCCSSGELKIPIDPCTQPQPARNTSMPRADVEPVEPIRQVPLGLPASSAPLDTV